MLSFGQHFAVSKGTLIPRLLRLQACRIIQDGSDFGRSLAQPHAKNRVSHEIWPGCSCLLPAGVWNSAVVGEGERWGKLWNTWGWSQDFSFTVGSYQTSGPAKLVPEQFNNTGEGYAPACWKKPGLCIWWDFDITRLPHECRQSGQSSFWEDWGWKQQTNPSAEMLGSRTKAAVRQHRELQFRWWKVEIRMEI